jgi:hypothetical protein
VAGGRTSSMHRRRALLSSVSTSTAPTRRSRPSPRPSSPGLPPPSHRHLRRPARSPSLRRRPDEMGGGGAGRPGRPARWIRRPEGLRGGRIHAPSSATRPWPDLGGGRGEPGAGGHPFAHVVRCRASCAGRGAPLRQRETEARPDDAELRDDDEHLRQLRDTRSSSCFARDSVLL